MEIRVTSGQRGGKLSAKFSQPPLEYLVDHKNMKEDTEQKSEHETVKSHNTQNMNQEQ